MEIKERIKKLLEQLNTGIYEKEEVMALALLSSIAGESIFLLGPPGVAKSLIARRLKYAYAGEGILLKNAKVFEYLMSRFSTPDEIFGPVAISKLKEDKYERIVQNYLPSADIVFLDEIWKAGPSIQNALLTILNEKIFRNGEKEIKVPMKALISASNELPAKDQGLEALWDRFLVRLIVDGIEDREKFNAMITMPQNLFDEKVDGGITDNEYEDWSKKIDQIAIPENVSNVIHVIRNKIKLHNQNEENAEKQIYVSDRRWRKIVRLMRTSAFVNHRSEVDLMDCFLIKHCIWNEESQIQTVSGFVNDAIRDYGPNLDMNLHTEREEFNKLKAEIEKNTSKKVGDKPKIYTDNNKTNYYRLKQPFENKYFLIESNIVDKITENSTRTTIFIDDFTENTSCYIKESSDEKNSILLSTREVYPEWDEWQTYELETEQVFELYKKPPSRGDFELWNKETKKLLDVLDEKKTEAEQYWGKFSGNFYDNIFVEKKNADDQIKSKIDTVILDIKEFRKEIEDICKKYQSIYKP